MQSQARTVAEYIAELPEDRRHAIEQIRAVILKNLPKGYEEGMQYGMIGYYVPHSIFPAGYHCAPEQPLPFASIASQKNHISIYLMCVYMDEQHKQWFVEAWQKSGKKLDMGKGCVRFKRLEQVPLEVVGETVRRIPVRAFVANYEGLLATMKSRPRGKAGAATKPATKPAAKRATGAAAAAPARKKANSSGTSAKPAPAQASAKKAASGRTASKKPASKKPASKKPITKKTVTKKAAGKQVARKKAASQ